MKTGVVFVVEDDELLLGVVAELLKGEGYEVRGFGTGGDFLAKVDTPPEACVLLDLHLPDMSGLEIQAKLNERKVALPVILVTALGDVGSAVTAMKAGAVDFLEKPVQHDLLLERVAQAIERGRSKRAAADIKAEAQAKIALLSRRETEVVELVVAGLANKQIAIELKISPKTVELHRGAAMKKIGARHVSDMVQAWLSARQDDAVS